MLIIYKVVIKKGSVRKFQKLAEETLIPEARKFSSCTLFSLYQNTVNEREFIFHEVWDTADDIELYKQNLVSILGQPHPGEDFPAVMNNLIESDEDLV